MSDFIAGLLVVVIFIIFICICVNIQAKQAEKTQRKKQIETEERMKEYERQKALRMAEQLRQEEEEKRLRKIRLEEKRKEIEERIQQHKEAMTKAWEALGVEDMLLDAEIYTITVREDIDVHSLFQTIKAYGEYNLYEFVVNQLDAQKLLSFILSPSFREYSGVYYHPNSVLIRFENGIPNKEMRGKNTSDLLTKMEKFLFCYLSNRRLAREKEQRENILIQGVKECSELNSNKDNIDDIAKDILQLSNYGDLFNKEVNVFYENDVLVVDYNLPSCDNFMVVKEYKYIASTNEVKEQTYSASAIAKEYERVLYSICLRTIYELFAVKKVAQIQTIVFNGFVTAVDLTTGRKERKCILSISVGRKDFENIDITLVDPKLCFKSLKGVSAAKLINVTPITPVLTIQREDRRFVESYDVDVNSSTNLAAMSWEDFEHLVRELFEAEFSQNGGEVKVTQASRDGGVDAVVFDPDPLRGGKIIIQAKRYTNTVGVSAVRDLYGTVINEGANSGILITTSDYGHDSYDFAKNKPLKLLNGGHLLALLQKHGRNAYINIQEAKHILD